MMDHFNYTAEELKTGEVTVDTSKALKISIEYKIKEILRNCSSLSITIRDFLKRIE